MPQPARRRGIFGAVKSYLGGVLIAIDQLGNSLLHGFPDETLSSRMGRRLKRKRRAIESEVACAVLDALDKDHCETSIEETSTGETDAHHLGRVIHELPPKPRPDPLRKIRGAGWVIVLALAFTSCAAIGRILDYENGTPPSTVPASPSPVITPTPTPDPSPQVSPSALPPPSSPAPPVSSPSPGVPCVQPSPSCVKTEGCVTCPQLIAGWLASDDLTRDAQGRLYNDPGGDVNNREYYDPVTCWVTRARDGLVFKRRFESQLCPVCPPVAVVTCPSAPPIQPSPIVTPPPGSLTESGNYPLPPAGVRPAWCPSAVSEVGISVLSQRKCAGRDAPPDCTITNLHATEKSVKPYCEHSCYDENGRYSLSNCRLKCETLKACQQPEFVDGNTGIRMLIAHPDWQDVFDICDKRTADCDLPDCRRNNICHDQAINRRGVTKAMACPPGVAVGDPGCTVHEYRSLP